MRKSLLLTLLLSVAGWAPVRADMDALIAELRREPLTLFDWGMFLMEEELQAVRRNGKDFLRVFYDPDNAEIVINAVFLVAPDEVAEIGRQPTCFTRLHAIKLQLGVIDTDKIHIAPASDFRLGMKFSHRDSDSFPELPDAAKIGADLMKSIRVKVGIATDLKHFPFNQLLHCESVLLEQKVDYRGATEQDIGPQ